MVPVAARGRTVTAAVAVRPVDSSVAVMTAAIHTVIQGPFRIVSIKDSNSEKKHDTQE